MNTDFDGYEESYVSDEQIRHILDEYRKKSLVENMMGPGISMTCHLVLLTLGILFISFEKEEKVPELVVQQVTVPKVDIDEDYDPPEDPPPEDPMPKPEDKPTDKPAISDADTQAVSQVDTVAPTPEEVSEITEINTTLVTNSILTFPGPLTNRGPKGRDGILTKHRANPDVEPAVNRALRWLKRVQNKNGSWGDLKTTFSQEGGHPAHTGLALLVFLAHGETPLSEEYGETVQNAMRWLAEYGSQSDLKRIVTKKHGAYTHGIATYALAESYAMTRIPFLQMAMEHSLEVLIDGQMTNGGFGYGYTSGARWDMSVAGWNMQALKAARMAGSTHPRLKDAIRKSINFCKIAYGGKGGFGYAEKAGDKDNMGGVGTVAMQLLGAHADRRAAEGCERIGTVRLKNYEEVMADPAKWESVGSKCLYGWYYDTQALFNTYKQDKPRWKRWQKAFESVLVRSQHSEGYWQTTGHAGGANTAGRVLATCFSALQLEVYYRYLPTFDPKALKTLEGDDGDDIDDVGNGDGEGFVLEI